MEKYQEAIFVYTEALEVSLDIDDVILVSVFGKHSESAKGFLVVIMQLGVIGLAKEGGDV